MRTRGVENGILVATVAMAAVVPFVLAPDALLFPFVAPKVFLLRAATAFLLAATLAVWIARRGESAATPPAPRVWTPLRIAVVAWLGSALLSAAFGVDPHGSFWSTPERMLGVVTILHVGALFFVAGHCCRGAGRWRNPMLCWVLSWSLVCVIAIAQKVDPQLLHNNGQTRVSATLGHPSYLGALGVFVCFVGVWLAAAAQHIGWRIALAAAALLGAIAVVISETRGSQLGLAVGVTVALAGGVVVSTGRQRKALAIALTSVVVVGGLVAFACTGSGPSWLSEVPGLRRFTDLSINSGTAETRWMAWSIALDAWQERPILGWGSGNYAHAFVRYFDPAFLNHNWKETWFDDAHSIPLNTLAVQGAVGLLTYLALFVVAAVLLWRRRTELPRMFVLGSGYLAAHFVHSLVVFESPTSYLGLFLFLAIVDARCRWQCDASEATTTAKASNPLLPKPLLGGALLVGGAVAFLVNGSSLAANRDGRTAYLAIVTQKQPLAAVEHAFATNSPYRHHVVDLVAGTLAQSMPQYAKHPEADALLDRVYQQLRLSCQERPLDLRGRLLLAQVISARVRRGAPAELFEESRVALEEALALGPNRPDAVYLLADVDMGQADVAGAVARLQEYRDRFPAVAETHWRLAHLYRRLGHLERAFQVIRSAKKQGVRFPPGPGRQVIATIEAEWQIQRAKRR